MPASPAPEHRGVEHQLGDAELHQRRGRRGDRSLALRHPRERLAPAQELRRARDARSARARGARRAVARAASRRSRPITLAPMWPRSFVSTAMPTPQPPCSGPSSASAGSSTSVKNTSSNSASPVICFSGRMSMPGRCSCRRGRTRCRRAWRLLASVRAIRIPQLLQRPPRAPHLLAVHDVAVAVALRPAWRDCRGRFRPRAR